MDPTATGLSEDAALLHLMHRALRRSDRELFGNRSRYEARLFQLAQRLIGRGV